ncbi:MAG: glycosyltransferase family 39 protein, partial [Candidatus Altiarchaeota archaeon]|nr:glycosyltransferase family 39 protein [Candidatus Altiarchaeota archaeon]
MKKKSLTRDLVWVVSVGLALRLILWNLFMSLYGAHAVRHVETWLYTGVMSHKLEDYLALGKLDPTYWILGTIGYLLPQQYHLWGVEACGIVLSTLTAAMLYMLVRKLYGGEAGFCAGILYASMVIPVLLSVAGFTHDHIQLTLILASIYLFILFLEGGETVYIAAYFIVLVLGYFINISILVSILVSAIIAAGKFSKKWYGVSYKLFFAVVISGFFVATFSVVPEYVGKIVEELPQGREGSADLMRVSFASFFLPYNILFILLPYGLYRAYKRGDIIGLSLFLCGLSLSTQMMRGLRITDLGFATIIGLALVDLQKKESMPVLGYRVHALRFYLSVGFLLFILLNTAYASGYAILFLTFGAALALGVEKTVRKTK